MANVAKVEPSPKNAEWRVVTMDDTRQFIVFSAGLADRLEIGKPLPQGTEEQPPKFDGALPSLKLPRPQGGGGMSAWRNTKEGFEAETRGRQRWQEIEEEKRDRRTALMQAVVLAAKPGVTSQAVLFLAEDYYAWLRSSPAPGGQEFTNVAQGPAQAVPGPSQTFPVEAGQEAAKAVRRPPEGSPPAQTGDTSSPASLEGPAASAEPGEGTRHPDRSDAGPGTAPSLGSTRFPVKPEDCNHKFGTTGNWLKPVTIAGMDHCPRCGMKTVLYRESDVGP